MEPVNFNFTVPGVGGINELMAGLESRIQRGMELDNQLIEREYHPGTEVRRRMRDSIRTCATMLDSLWDMFEMAHMQDKCEHTECEINSQNPAEISASIMERKEMIAEVISHCDTLDMAAGTEIMPEPPAPSMDDPMEILRRIIDMTNPN